MKATVVGSDLLPLAFAVGAGPIFIFPRGPWLWTLLAVPAIWAVRGILGLKWIRRTPIDAAVALLVIWTFFGMLGIADIGDSAVKIAGLVYGAVLFFSLAEALKTEGRMKFGICVFLALGAVIAVVGIMNPWIDALPAGAEGESLLRPVPRVELKLERAEAGINPNPVGGTLTLFIPLGFAIAGTLLKKGNGILASGWRFSAAAGLGGILAVCVAAVYLTESFGAWIGIGVALLMLGRWRRLVKGFAVIAVITVALLLVYAPSPKAVVGGSTILPRLLESLSTRIPLWEVGLTAARDHPVFGVGMDRLRMTPLFKYEDAHAHNQFIHTAAEMGIPALIAYLAILAGAGWMAVQVARSRMPPWMISAMRGLFLGQVGFAIFGLADAIALGSKPGVFFWMSLAFMASIYLHGREHGLLGNPETEPGKTA